MYKRTLTAIIFAVVMAWPWGAYALNFYINADYPGVLLLMDRFEHGDQEKFKKHVTENDIDTIAFNSSGGSLMPGVEIGRMIRDMELNTVVPKGGYCYSACAYTFMGGVERSIEEGSPFAMHRPYFNDSFDSAAAGDYVDGYNSGIVAGVMITYYLIEMGLAPEVASLHLMSIELAHFSTEQQEQLNITTTTAEQVVPRVHIM